MDEKELLEAIGQMMDEKLDALRSEMNERFDKLEHKSDVLMTGVRLANSKLTKVTAVQDYTIDQLELLDEVKMDKDPLRKRA